MQQKQHKCKATKNKVYFGKRSETCSDLKKKKKTSSHFASSTFDLIWIIVWFWIWFFSIIYICFVWKRKYCTFYK